MFDFWLNYFSKERKSRDERQKTNVSKPRSVTGRRRSLVTKTLNSRLSSALKTPKTKMNRRTSGD